MKTKLLLLFLAIYSTSFAQFNITEGFESGSNPVGWGPFAGFYSLSWNGVNCSGSRSAIANLSGTNTYASALTPAYTSNGNQINISYRYKRTVGAFTGTVRMYYDVDLSNSWTEIINSTYFSTDCNPLNGTIAAGVVPSGSTVRFRIQANRTTGSTTLIFDDFSAIQNTATPTFQIIAEYNFNNTYNNVLGTNPFASNAGTSFITDRNGTANSAINISNTGSTATILNLPYGNSSRTIAFWAKLNTIQNPYNFTFSYGQGSGSNATGGSFNSSVVEFFGYANNLSASSSSSQDEWYFFTYTYDGSNAKIYKNGVLLNSVPKSWNTINNSNLFNLGIGVGNEYNFNGAIDDLKIYNNALDESQILELYNTNALLSSQNFAQNNLKVSLYPNPAKDVVTIETTANIKMIEIYNVEGRKVLSSHKKQIHVSNLTSGMYVVKIQDENNAIVSRKIIIE